jgi:glycosyltransferase involved in cell wall biosynthesis
VTSHRSANVLVIASTFPSSVSDPVPAFVRDQVVAISQLHPELTISVLAPHDRRSATADFSSHEGYDEHRFHYVWPRRAESLAGRGIMPALRQNPALYATVPFLFLGEFFAALTLTRRVRPAVIYAHWFTPQAVIASWVSTLTRTPFVFTTHASDVDVWRRVPFFGPRLVRAVTRRASAISAVSTRSRDKLTAFLGEGAGGDRIHVIPMGVSVPDVATTPDERATLRRSRNLDSHFVLLSIGRLVEKKGLHHLLAALNTIGADLPEWTLVIAGDGPLREDLQRTAAEFGLAERVRFVGYVTGRDKEEWLQSADALVVPSVVASDGDAEGLPVALLEGLAHGLICVATNESGADDVLTHGVDGFLCSQKDEAALAALLRDVCELDATARRDVGSKARARAQSFRWDSIAAAHYDLLLAPVLTSRGNRE